MGGGVGAGKSVINQRLAKGLANPESWAYYTYMDAANGIPAAFMQDCSLTIGRYLVA